MIVPHWIASKNHQQIYCMPASGAIGYFLKITSSESVTSDICTLTICRVRLAGLVKTSVTVTGTCGDFW